MKTEWRGGPLGQSGRGGCCRENKDYNGVELEIGTRVAYNRSGDVVLGRVVGFTGAVSTHSKWLIQQSGDKGKPSRVAHKSSIVALPFMFVRDPKEM